MVFKKQLNKHKTNNKRKEKSDKMLPFVKLNVDVHNDNKSALPYPKNRLISGIN